MSKAPNKPAQQPRRTTRARQTVVYLTDDLTTRLARYMLAKYPGRLNVRNQIIVDAINDKLTKEGF
jgi:hypothetical protein